jgi:hypothetical protein
MLNTRSSPALQPVFAEALASIPAVMTWDGEAGEQTGRKKTRKGRTASAEQPDV